MYRRRTISNLLAALILIAVMVGIGIAVAVFTGTFAQKTKPTGSSLVILGITAKKMGSSGVFSRRVLVTITLQNTGSESVYIDWVQAYRWDGRGPYSLQGWEKPGALQPNKVATISGYFDFGTNVPVNNNIQIIIRYHTVSGEVGRISQVVNIEPSIP